MEQARALIAAMRREEGGLLTKRMASAERQGRVAIALIGVSTALLVFIGLLGTILLSRSITRPLAALVRASEQFGRGERPVVPEGGRDEIGDLARAFVAMARARDDAEARVRAVFEAAPDGVFVADRDGFFTEVNTAGGRMVGYPREELVGRSIRDLVVPEELSRQAALKTRLLEGATEVSEWQMRRKDGTCMPAELSTTALPDGRLMAFVRDVTDRREAEERLRFSEAKFSGIVSISSDAIIVIDEEQRITTFNAGAKGIFGYSKAEILGSPLEALIPDRFRLDHRRHVERFAAGQETARRMGERGAALIGLRKSREEFPIDAAISKIDVGGQRLFTVSLRDISEERRLEHEQQFLAETGKILVSAGSDYQRLLGDIASLIVRDRADFCAVSVVKGSDVNQLRVVAADSGKAGICDALERLPLDRARPNPFSRVADSHQPTLVAEVTAEYLQSLAQSAEHLRLLRALTPTSLIVVPLVAREHMLGTLAFGSSGASRRYGVRDVTEAEQLATRLALAVDNARLHEALEGAVRARQEVLGIVAHDLRNPLNAIALQAAVLRRSQGEGGGVTRRRRKRFVAPPSAWTGSYRICSTWRASRGASASRCTSAPFRRRTFSRTRSRSSTRRSRHLTASCASPWQTAFPACGPTACVSSRFSRTFLAMRSSSPGAASR